MSKFLSNSFAVTRKNFYEILLKIKYSIDCNLYFPYKYGKCYFDWKDFFEKLKDLDIPQMKEIVFEKPSSN